MNTLLFSFVLSSTIGAESVKLDAATIEKLGQIAISAAREGDLKTIEEYVKEKLPLDVKSSRGDTLLILAAYHGHSEIVELLASQPSIKIDELNKMGFTALSGAAFKGDAKITKILLKYKANPNTANESGQTPLMLAAMMGREEVAKILIESGAKTDAKTKDGQTPLSLAQQQDRKNIIKLLESLKK